MTRDKANQPDETHSQQSPLSVAELRQLISLMNGSDIDEIGIEEDATGLRLSLRKPTPVTVAGGAITEEDLYDALVVEELDIHHESSAITVRAPLVGVFRTATSRGGRALVLGDVVHEGKNICAVEALNVYNEVEAPASGRVSAVFVSDGQPVEYGQPLLEIEPNS